MHRRELLLILLFYLFMALAYFFALVIDTGINYHAWPVTINYTLKGGLTIPLWWLFFKGLKKQEGKKQLFETVILRTRVVFLLFP